MEDKSRRGLLEGELQTTQNGMVQGWIGLVGTDNRMPFNFRGELANSLRGGKFILLGIPMGARAGLEQCVEALRLGMTGAAGDGPVLGAAYSHNPEYYQVGYPVQVAYRYRGGYTIAGPQLSGGGLYRDTHNVQYI
jgi:hypothetical protein